MNVREPRSASGWILLAGFALASLGLVAESNQQDRDAQDRTQILPITPGVATADSNDQMIAVTGVDVTGGSLLYIIDTVNRQLSVYQAQGGTKSTMKLEWVGGRNIDLDLRVDGFNDKSQFSYKDLESKFAPDGDLSDE